MKRIISLLLSILMLLTSCTQTLNQRTSTGSNSKENLSSDNSILDNMEPKYDSLDDVDLLAYVEDLVYRDTILSLNSADYVVENVSAVYVSNEYLDELAFNSQSNIYFGYSLVELDKIFQGTRYIFTLADDGLTTVQKLQEIEDISTGAMLKNIAIGTGVILICVTVSILSSGLGAPAVSLIFAASAETAKIAAISSAAFGGISAGIITGIQTGDFNEAMKAAALAGTEGFKWGAITGAIIGGTKEAFILKAATKNGLSMNEVAKIQRESILPKGVIEELHSMNEYMVYKEAGLKPIMVNGRTALVQNIDLNYVSKLPDGTELTNLTRMRKGLAPLDPITGKAYQLHHIGQKSEATLAVLKESQHQGNSKVLNIIDKVSEIDRDAFEPIRKEFWEYMGNVVYANGGR